MTSLLAFTPEQVCRVTGLSRRQLSYWDKSGFIRHQYTEATRAQSRIYAFKDVVLLMTLAKLEDQLPLQELRKIGAWLSEHYDQPWDELRFFVVAREVLFRDPDSHSRPSDDRPSVQLIELAEVERIVSIAATELLDRSDGQIGNVVRHRHVQRNAWVVDGTRIPTSAIWELHTAGFDHRAIQKEYPRLTTRDIEAAIHFETMRSRRAG